MPKAKPRVKRSAKVKPKLKSSKPSGAVSKQNTNIKSVRKSAAKPKKSTTSRRTVTKKMGSVCTKAAKAMKTKGNAKAKPAKAKKSKAPKSQWVPTTWQDAFGSFGFEEGLSYTRFLDKDVTFTVGTLTIHNSEAPAHVEKQGHLELFATDAEREAAKADAPGSSSVGMAASLAFHDVPQREQQRDGLDQRDFRLKRRLQVFSKGPKKGLCEEIKMASR